MKNDQRSPGVLSLPFSGGPDPRLLRHRGSGASAMAKTRKRHVRLTPPTSLPSAIFNDRRERSAMRFLRIRQRAPATAQDAGKTGTSSSSPGRHGKSGLFRETAG